MTTREAETAALIALLQNSKSVGDWGTIAARVSAEGSAWAVLHESGDALFPDPSAGNTLHDARSEVQGWRDRGLKLTTVLDTSYPNRLRDIREMPPFLFYEGDLRPDDEGMSVVGSRRATSRGRAAADAVARLLVEEELTVIAGLAEGIDTAAHQAALNAGGRTVAFIGTGITRQYPAANAILQAEIAQRGLILSQFYPDASPTKRSFPMRNVTMSGYGLATIVVEAGEHSGSRIQARVAGKHGRPVILTDRVAESTSWGAELVGSPNVYVAGSIGEMRRIVREIRNSPLQLDDALSDLMAS